MTSTPHLNLTMSSLGAESYHQPQNTQKQRKENHTQDTQNKTNIHIHIYKLAHSPQNTHQIKNKTTHIYKTNHQK